MDDLLRKTLEKQALRGSSSVRGRGRGRGGNTNKADKKLGGRSLHLSYLINDGLLYPGTGVLKMEYFGNVFEGDLLEDGSVKWKDNNLVFATPSAWASHCKRIVNPDKKSACGWTTVKYEGRKLEWYKNQWLQMQAARADGSAVIQQFQDDDFNENDSEDDNASQSQGESEACSSAAESMVSELPQEPVMTTSSSGQIPQPATTPISSTSATTTPPANPEQPEQPSTSALNNIPSSEHQQVQLTETEQAMMEQAVNMNNHQVDIASLAQMLLGEGATKLSDMEKLVLEKALKEQMAVEAAVANRLAEAEMLKQHSEAAALLQKQSKSALEQKQREEALLQAQQEAIIQAQLQQEALHKIQQEILAAHKEKEEKEKRDKAKQKEQRASSKEKASAQQHIDPALLQKSLLEHSMIQNALLNQAALEKAIQEHNASGSNDKMTQMILEQALFQQANMIQLAIAQLAEEQAKAARTKEREIMKEARQDAVPAESSLIDCVKFSVVGQKQPYTVFIGSNSLLLMDYHCHLSTDEVYGYLGGKWDPNKLTLQVQSVFPCSLNNPSDQTECTVLQNKIRELITQQDMTVIGWYHSHPTSSPRPSQHDIVCQSVHQQHMRSLDGRIDPCLGVIVSPFRGSTPTSEMQLFCVMHTNDGRPVPMHLEYTCVWDSTISPALATEMRAMSLLYSQQKSGVKFDQHWRNNMNIFRKMTESLKQKTPKDISEEQFVDVMRQIVAKEE